MKISDSSFAVDATSQAPDQSATQLDCQDQQTCIRRNRDSRQYDDNVSTCSEFPLVESIVSNFGEELLVPLLPSEQTDEQYSSSIDCEERWLSSCVSILSPIENMRRIPA